MIKDYANDISSIWFSYFFLSDRIELMLYDPPSLENSILGVTLLHLEVTNMTCLLIKPQVHKEYLKQMLFYKINNLT